MKFGTTNCQRPKLQRKAHNQNEKMLNIQCSGRTCEALVTAEMWVCPSVYAVLQAVMLCDHTHLHVTSSSCHLTAVAAVLQRATPQTPGHQQHLDISYEAGEACAVDDWCGMWSGQSAACWPDPEYRGHVSQSRERSKATSHHQRLYNTINSTSYNWQDCIKHRSIKTLDRRLATEWVLLTCHIQCWRLGCQTDLRRPQYDTCLLQLRQSHRTCACLHHISNNIFYNTHTPSTRLYPFTQSPSEYSRVRCTFTQAMWGSWKAKMKTIFTRDSIYAIARIYYRPSIRLCIRWWYHRKTVEVRIMFQFQFSPYGSPIPLVFVG